MDSRISGKTRLLGVFGSPIEHSISPAMYNYCFDRYDLDMVYLAFLCKEDGVPDAAKSIRTLNISGANITMPCKEAFAKNMDKLSPVAELVGAVNTVINKDGVLEGHITDGQGVVGDLRDKGIEVKGKSIVVLGAGGAATAIIAQMAFESSKSVTVFNRSKPGLDKINSMNEKMKDMGISCELSCHLLEEEKALTASVREADILINATSVGMEGVSPGESVVKDMEAFHKGLFVYDCIYNPSETKLMKDAAANGVKPDCISNGRGMLLWQGAAAFKLYTGLEMPVHDLQEYLDKRA